MEGGHTQQAPPPASVQWLQFAEWLRQHAGGPPEEAVSEVSASDAEEVALPAEPAHASCSSSFRSSSSSSSLDARSATTPSSGGRSEPPTPVSAGQLMRPTSLAPRLPDCRAEMRLTSESSSRARQEMTVLLAAPGMPMHEAPVLTCKQASALMAAICEPLLSLPVGRLTRKLAAPTKLQPTEDRGLLSLWLLPDDSLSLVWQSTQQAAPEEAASSSSSSSQPLQQSCSVAVWEELAHFPAMAHLLDDAPVVTIHMLRGDASGRSFYIRVRNDVAEANLEAATASLPDASRLLQQQERAMAAAGGSDRGSAAAAAAEAEGGGAPRMYFWLTDKDLARAVYSLGRLKSLLKRPPTLSKRSGVPERQLAQLGAWVQRADAAAAAQQQRDAAAAAAAAAAPQQLDADRGSADWLRWGSQQGEGESSLEQALAPARTPSSAAANSVRTAGPLSPLLAAPGLLLGDSMAAAAHMRDSAPSSPLPASSASAAAASLPSSAGVSEGAAGALASGSSTVSATAAALYQDKRFNLVCPCTISVVVSTRMQAPGADPALLTMEASARARTVAERQAKSAVDRSGRQRIEERLAEVVIRNIRTQRNRARAARQAQRDSAARAARQQHALELARQATGRTPSQQGTPSTPASPVQEQPQQEAAAAADGAAPQHTSPFALVASTSGDSELLPTAATPCSAADAVGTPARAGSGECSESSPTQPNGRAFSSPAALPMPAALLPGSRVTLGNLQSLLEATSSHKGADSELPGATAGATAATRPEGSSGAASAPSGPLSIADLADLLGKHAKLD